MKGRRERKRWTSHSEVPRLPRVGHMSGFYSYANNLLSDSNSLAGTITAMITVRLPASGVLQRQSIYFRKCVAHNFRIFFGGGEEGEGQRFVYPLLFTLKGCESFLILRQIRILMRED